MLQVGGHPGAVHDHGAYIVKDCKLPEARFYVDLYKDRSESAQSFMAWIPTCYGVADEFGDWLPGWPQKPLEGLAPGPSHRLVLENLLYPFAKPNVCDIKLGTKLYREDEPDLTDAKRARMDEKARTTTSGKFGIRVTGWCTWSPATQSYYESGRELGRAARTKQDLLCLLQRALDPAVEPAWRAQLRAQLLPRLSSLCESLKSIPVETRSASVLIVTEGDAAARADKLKRNESILDVRLIDFAHTQWGKDPDPGTQIGLCNIRDLSQLALM